MALGVDLSTIDSLSRTRRTSLRRRALRLYDEAREVLKALDDALEHDFAAAVANRPLEINRNKLIKSFHIQPPSMTELAVLQVLHRNPRSTSAELSSLLGWEGQSWHMHFGDMCRRRESQLWPAGRSEVRDADFYGGILAFLSLDNRWVLWPEVADAFGKTIGEPTRSRFAE